MGVVPKILQNYQPCSQGSLLTERTLGTRLQGYIYENALGSPKLHTRLNQYSCNKQTIVCFQMHFYFANEYTFKFILLLYYNSSNGKN